MEDIIFAVFILLLVCTVFQLTKPQGCAKKAKKCSCCNASQGLYGSVREPSNSSMFDVEQDTRSRGIVPMSAQPDHIANLWKCDHSHMKPASAGCSEQSSYFENGMSIRKPVVNQDVGAVSNMHIVSRFGAV